MVRMGLTVKAVCRACHGFDRVQPLCHLGDQQSCLVVMTLRGCQMPGASRCWKLYYVKCIIACSFLEISNTSKIYSLPIRIFHVVDYHHR